VQKILGLPKIEPPAAPAPAAGEGDLMPGDPGYDEAGTEPADQGGVPGLPSVQDAVAGKVGKPGQKLAQLAASAARDAIPLFWASDAAVRRAMEIAGGRLVPGPARARYAVPKHELHTRVVADQAKVPSLLAGAWTHIREQAPALGVDSDALEDLLGGYCTELLTRGLPHDPSLLKETLLRARGDLTP